MEPERGRERLSVAIAPGEHAEEEEEERRLSGESARRESAIGSAMEHHPYEQHVGDDSKKLEAELDGADGSFKNKHHKRSKAAMEHSDEQHEEDGSKKVEAAELDGADRSLKNEHQIQSKVWDEFEPIFLNDKVQFAECLSCHFLFSCNGDSCLHRHQETCPAKPEAAERPQVDSEVPSLKKQKTSSMNIANDMSASKFGQESCYQDVARMIILHGYPLSIVEHEEMGRIFKSLNPVANTVSCSDMEEHLLDLFQKEKMSLRDKIALTSRCVSLSASIWTDDGPEPTVKYLCLTAHFIDEDWRIQRRIIKFGMYWCSPTNLERTIHCKEAGVPDSESGPYNVIWDAIRDWNLDHKILSLTSVGEIKNDANTAKLKAMLMEKRCLPIRGKLCNIACLDDMINNVVAEGQSDILVLIGDTVMDFFVAHASSPLAQQQLLEAISQMSLKCPLEDAKWWHKFYFRLEVLLQFKKLYPAEEVLSPEDMRVTESIWKILRTFYRAIEVISGPSPPTSNIYFGEVWKVRTVLQEEASNENVEIATLVMVLQHAFNEYWQNSYVCLSIPVVLDPRFKMSFIEFRLRRAYGAGSASYLSEIRDTVQELFSEYYKPMNQLNGAVVSSSADDKDSLEDWDEHVSSQISSELDDYLGEGLVPREDDFDILKWWMEHATKYPTLAAIARDVLAMPASAVRSEAAFSSTGPVIPKHHSALSIRTIEALVCSRDWMR